jgi:hypothetical protein
MNREVRACIETQMKETSPDHQGIVLQNGERAAAKG